MTPGLDNELPGPDDAPVYTASAVAARLGVAVETLRTWDRRYGLGPSTRGPGGRRRYGPKDVARLLVMRRLVASGMPTAEAARRAASTDPAEASDVVEPGGGSPRRSGGGRVLAVPRGTLAQHGLARAATALDVDEVERLLEQTVRAEGVAPAWDGLLRPVLVAIGERWARTGEGVEIEHLLSLAATDVFRRIAGEASAEAAPDAASPVILASVDGDVHVLPLYVLAAALARRGVRVRLLGASTPVRALSDAVTRLRPRGLFLWAQLERPDLEAFVPALEEIRLSGPFAVGGPGWKGVALPDSFRRAEALADAVQILDAN